MIQSRGLKDQKYDGTNLKELIMRPYDILVWGRSRPSISYPSFLHSFSYNYNFTTCFFSLKISLSIKVLRTLTSSRDCEYYTRYKRWSWLNIQYLAIWYYMNIIITCSTQFHEYHHYIHFIPQVIVLLIRRHCKCDE